MSFVPIDPDSLLAGLDPEQAEVATSFGVPVGVVAGAGTGKTRAITHRIAYAVREGRYDAAGTLAVTFTTRAAGEMRSRLASLGVRSLNEIIGASELFSFALSSLFITQTIAEWIAALDVETPAAFGPVLHSLWGSLFTALSFLTTTGFESASWDDARHWSGLGTPGLILAGLAITGGGIATTAGGVRLLRVYALLRHGERELNKLVHPASIAGGGPTARKLRREGAYIAWIFFMLFAMSIAVVMMAVSLTGLAFEPATIMSIAALSNTGPLAAFAADTPLSWADLGDATKFVLAAAMVLGRLETLAIIALFNPEFWRG